MPKTGVTGDAQIAELVMSYMLQMRQFADTFVPPIAKFDSVKVYPVAALLPALPV